MLKAYLKKIADTSKRGDAREESYYPVLKELLDEYCSSISKKNIHITPQPKKTEAETPISEYGMVNNISRDTLRQKTLPLRTLIR